MRLEEMNAVMLSMICDKLSIPPEDITQAFLIYMKQKGDAEATPNDLDEGEGYHA